MGSAFHFMGVFGILLVAAQLAIVVFLLLMIYRFVVAHEKWADAVKAVSLRKES